MARSLPRAAVSLVALCFALFALPAIALAAEVVSLPTTVTSGQAFDVGAIWVREDDAVIVASKMGSATTLTFPLVASTRTFELEGDKLPLKVAHVTLPQGGDWLLTAHTDSDSEQDSEPKLISCDTIPVRVTVDVNHSWVSFGSLPKCTISAHNPDGTPLANANIELLSVEPEWPGRMPIVKRILHTDAAGVARSSLPPYVGTELPSDTEYWAIRVRGTAGQGAYVTRAIKTKLKTMVNRYNNGIYGHGSASGTVHLVAGRKYRFSQAYEPAAGRNRGSFVLLSSSGRAVMSAALDRYTARTFNVRTTGTYRWRMTLTKGYYVGWLLW